MTEHYFHSLPREEQREIDDYLDRFQDVPPHQLLSYMGELSQFFSTYMTPEGRTFFERSRLEEKASEHK